MRSSVRSISVVDLDLCRYCRFADFRASKQGQDTSVTIVCHRLDCDNFQTMPLASLPQSPIPPIPTTASHCAGLRRFWQHILDGLKAIW